MTWEEFTDIVGCGENAYNLLEEGLEMEELFDTGSVTVKVAGRTFVITLNAQEVVS